MILYRLVLDCRVLIVAVGITSHLVSIVIQLAYLINDFGKMEYIKRYISLVIPKGQAI